MTFHLNLGFPSVHERTLLLYVAHLLYVAVFEINLITLLFLLILFNNWSVIFYTMSKLFREILKLA